MREIFVSYRREDSSDSAARLCGDLTEQFGRDAVFRDVATLAPGSDFAATIRETIPQAEVVLVVIGKQWLRVLRRRLDDPTDLLVTEIDTALAHRARVLVIPVLVQRATMPKVSQLPESLQGLCTVNAIELDDDPRWDFDMRRLVSAIEARVPRRPSAPPLVETAAIEAPALPAEHPPAAPSAPEVGRRNRRWTRPATGVTGALALALLISGLLVVPSGGDGPESQPVVFASSSSLPEPATTLPPTSVPVSTTVGPTARGGPSTTRGGGAVAADTGTGRASGPGPASPPTTPPPAPPATPATTTATTIGQKPTVAAGQLAIAPQSGPPGTVITLSANACARPAGWSGGEIYYGLNDPRATKDVADGRRWWTASEPWQGQLTVPALPSGEYWVWANCYASTPTSQWEMFYLYSSVAFRVT